MFECGWLALPNEVPDWLYPAVSNVIITQQQINEHTFVELTPTGEKIDERVLSWFIVWGLQRTGNIVWRTSKNRVFYFGSNEFAHLMRQMVQE
jgi:hypothetical protein